MDMIEQKEISVKEDLELLCDSDNFEELIDLFVSHLKLCEGDEDKINDLKEEAVSVLNDMLQEEKDEAVSYYRENVLDALRSI